MRRSTERTTLIDDLIKIVGHENTVYRPEDLLVYESDGTADRAMPAVVVLPASAEEVEAVVRCARRHDMPVVPRGAGTGLSGGALSAVPGIVIGTARMKRMLDLNLEDRTAIVEPGMVNADLSAAVLPHGLFYAPDPSSQKACTIGGNVSENSGGPHCLLYGMTVNHILGVEVVTISGERFWVGGAAPDEPGYDLVGALVGSEGTLAVVTAVMVRLLPVPEATATLVAIFDTIDDAGETVTDIIAEGLVPAALEIMDRTTIQAVEPAVHAGYPEDAEAVLLVELDGSPLTVGEDMSVVRRVCDARHAREVRIAESRVERERLWAGRKGALGALGRLAPNYFIQDGVVPRTQLREVLAKIGEIGARYDLTIANVVHAGDGNLHPNILFDAREPGMLARVREAGAEILRVCTDAGGSITGEHGVGLDKQDYLGWMFSSVELDVMKLLKGQFDPDGALNPGKLFPGAKGCGEIQGGTARLALAAML
jgi:glycolate oxidase